MQAQTWCLSSLATGTAVNMCHDAVGMNIVAVNLHNLSTLLHVTYNHRCGKETFPARAEKTESSIKYHGGSFITGYTGEIIKQVISHTVERTGIV
jgi:hypothetical protein